MREALHPMDWVVLVGYVVGITAFGLWTTRRIKSSAGYFLGDRKFRWWVMVGQAFGTGTHAEQPAAQAGASFEKGFATIWYQWKNMLITPFYWLIAPWYRRLGGTTVGDLVAERYGGKLGLAYSIFAISFFVFIQGVMLKGAGKVISIAVGDHLISPNGVVLAMTVAFLLYSYFGGLVAAAYTEFVQGFLIIVMSFMLVPLGLREIGGIDGMRAALPGDFFRLYSDESGLTMFTIAMLAVNGLVGIVAQPHMVSMTASGSTERAGRVGMTYGALLKRFCTIGWVLVGLVVAAMVAQGQVVLPDREMAFGFACRQLLAPGLVGLMVACVLAANMSSCSNFMVNSGALFSRNLYRTYWRPAADDRRLLLVGRLSGLGLTTLGIGFALTVRNVLDAFLFTETIAAFVGIMILGGILWKRANRWGAWASLAGAFAVYYGLHWWEDGVLKLVYSWTAVPFGWAILAGFVSLIVVSLVTPAENGANIERFFGKLGRSSDTHDGQGGGAPSGSELFLVDAGTWFRAERWKGFWKRYREDAVGFMLAWGSVGLLVLGAWGLVQIGK